MQALLDVILPVFLVIGFGYVATWRGLFTDQWVEGLMKFTQGFAIPCLLFRAISTLDLSVNFQPPLLVAFYTGAITCFVVGIFGARALFKRTWEHSVAIGFVALFSNTVLLGLPITERAYGADALAANFAIIAFHTPFCYFVGITTMEIVRARGASKRDLPIKVLKAMFSNALIIGVGAGFVVNLLNIPMPVVLTDAMDMMVRAALPAALFGLGGTLYRYRPEGSLPAILFICIISLILHPVIVYGLGSALQLSEATFRSAILTSAMAPGINAYIFANMYDSAKRVAASAVLIGTALSVLTAWCWLGLLG